MNAKQLKILAAVVGALLAIWGITALLPSGTDRPVTDFRLPHIAADSIGVITIATPVDTVVLARAANAAKAESSWTVNGLTAAHGKVEDLIATLGESVRPELVAHSKTSFMRLGVDSTASRRLRVLAKASQRALLDVIVSAQGVGFEGTFVRRPGDSAVYSWPGRLGELVRRSVNDWRDNVIATVATDSVRRIEVTRGTRHYVLRKESGHWRVGDAPADSAAAARLVAAFKTVTASGFPTPKQLDSAFRANDRIERRVTVFGAGTKPLLSLDFDSTSNAFWVRRSTAPTIYRLNTWEADQLTPADSTLRRRAK
ncbi:MAG TPA: DUF4340 domain-containing protein [Gemmatimonadales bacterium]|nr:DUF4340 domain-containing protein [Gemmatimonadales bacterium]